MNLQSGNGNSVTFFPHPSFALPHLEQGYANTPLGIGLQITFFQTPNFYQEEVELHVWRIFFEYKLSRKFQLAEIEKIHKIPMIKSLACVLMYRSQQVPNFIEQYHRADMRRSLGMNIFCQKNNISACKMWFIEYKCTNCSRNCKYKCTLHPNIMADPRLTYSSCNSRFCDNTHFVNVRSMQYTLWRYIYDFDFYPGRLVLILTILFAFILQLRYLQLKKFSLTKFWFARQSCRRIPGFISNLCRLGQCIKV